MAITNHGYRVFSRNGKNVYEHRDVMEKHLGRKLETFEIVHHIDRNKLNNLLENLEIVCKADHNRHHYFSNPKKIEYWKKNIMSKGVQARICIQTKIPEATREGIIWRRYYIDKHGKRKTRSFITKTCKYCGQFIWSRFCKPTKSVRVCKHYKPY